MIISDEALMQAYQAGDPLAFETLYLRCSPKLYGYLKKKLGNSPDVDDVFQQVLLKLHRTRQDFDPRYRFEQWLFVIARTTALDHLRKHQRTEAFLDREQNAEQVAGKNEPAEAKPELNLQSLSEDQRKVVEHKVVDELTYQEIAQRLEKSEMSVRQLFSRAVRKLKKNQTNELKLKGGSRS